MERQPISAYVIGADYGRDRDHSALAVIAVRTENSGPYDRFNLVQPVRRILELGYLRRVPIGTEYLKVMEILRRLVNKLHAAAGWAGRPVNVHLIVDAAGPGQVAMELIRAQRLNINFVPAVLTGARDAGQSASGARTIPRREIITNLRFLLESQTLRVSGDLQHGPALEAEVAAVQPDGGQRSHDDLVIATGLAAWYAPKVYPDIIRTRRAA